MTWYKEFYVGEGIAKKEKAPSGHSTTQQKEEDAVRTAMYKKYKRQRRRAEIVKWKVIHNARQFDIYVIALSSNPDNLLDIIPAWELRQKHYPKSDMLVVGIDKGYDNAIELAGKIVKDVYHKTGDFNIRDYFLKTHKDNLRKEPVWKSYS